MANVCNSCFKEFSSTSSLQRHKRDIHNGKYSIIKKQTPVICCTCDKHFANRSSYNRHDREVHKQELPHYVELVNPATRFHCLDCSIYFYSNMDLRFHLDEKHEEPWELDKMEFFSDDGFQRWLLTEQASKNLYYVLSRGASASSGKRYYECWRSASSNYSSLKIDRKRALKNVGSCKMPFACTSQIIVDKDCFTGHIKVSYFKTHYGHRYEDDIIYLRLSEAEKEAIASKLTSGVSPISILAEAKRSRRNSHEPLKRLDFLRIGDIKKVQKTLKSDSKVTRTENYTKEHKISGENIELPISPNHQLEERPESSTLIEDSSEELETNEENTISQIENGLQTISSRIKNKEYAFHHLQEVLKNIKASLETLNELDCFNSETKIINDDLGGIDKIENDFNSETSTIIEDSCTETIEDQTFVKIEEVREENEDMEYVDVVDDNSNLDNDNDNGISDVTDSEEEVITINLGDFENEMYLGPEPATVEYAQNEQENIH